MYYKLLIIITVLSGMVLTGCNDADEKAVESGTIFPENMRGVWQWQPFDDGDEYGLFFTDKNIGDWDYAGDEFDQGDDCYFYADTVAVLVSFEGSEFRIRDLFFDEEETVTIKIDGNTMTVTGEDEEGSFQEVLTKDNRTISQLVPICEEVFKRDGSEAKRARGMRVVN